MLGRSAEIAQLALQLAPNQHDFVSRGRRQDEGECVVEKKNLQKDLFRMEKILYNIKTNQSRLCVRWHLNKLNSMQVNELSGYIFFAPYLQSRIRWLVAWELEFGGGEGLRPAHSTTSPEHCGGGDVGGKSPSLAYKSPCTVVVLESVLVMHQ